MRASTPSALPAASVRCLVLVLLLAASAPAQAAVSFSGDVTASAVAARGGPFLVSGAPRFLGVEDVPVGAVLSLEAAWADVVVHRQPFNETGGSVQVPTDGGHDTTADPPVRHVNVSAVSVRVGFASYLQAEGTDGPGRADGTASAVVDRVEARSRLDFHRPEYTGNEWTPYRAGPWPGLDAVGDAGRVTWTGDVVVSFYDVDLRLDADDGTTLYETGEVEASATPSHDVALLRSGERRRVDVTLHDAVLRYDAAGAPFRLYLASATLDVVGTAVLEDARGDLSMGGESVPVHGDAVLFGDWTAFLAPAGDRVALDPRGTLDALRVAGAPVPLSAAPEPPLAATRWSWATPLLLAGAAVVVAAVLRAQGRRLDPDTLVLAASADVALRPRRAARWAGRALRANVDDEEAAVVRAVALYRAGRHAEGVAWLEAWLAAHPDAGPEVSMLLGLGLLELGGPGEAEGPVRRALERDPSLRRWLVEAPRA